MKSDKNKTIDISAEEGKVYLANCLNADSDLSLDSITDKTVMGDSFSLMEKLPRGFADLVIADPPYNLDKEFHGNKFKKTDDDTYAVYTEKWVKAVLPLMKENASIYVCCDWQSSSALYSVLKKYFKIQNRITWQREKGRGAMHNWKNAMEDIWFCSKNNNYTFNVEDVKIRRKVIAPYKENGKPKDWEQTDAGNFRNTYPSNFWDDISIPYWSMPENTAHPTQKPEKLLAKLILASSNVGDFVFDPFLGSGSSSVTAKKLGRHYCGIEENPQYCAWTEIRLQMANEDKSIQGYTEGVFWERNTADIQKRLKVK